MSEQEYTRRDALSRIINTPELRPYQETLSLALLGNCAWLCTQPVEDLVQWARGNIERGAYKAAKARVFKTQELWPYADVLLRGGHDASFYQQVCTAPIEGLIEWARAVGGTEEEGNDGRHKVGTVSRRLLGSNETATGG